MPLGPARPKGFNTRYFHTVARDPARIGSPAPSSTAVGRPEGFRDSAEKECGKSVVNFRPVLGVVTFELDL